MIRALGAALALALACPAYAQTTPGATARAIANAAGSLGVSASPTLLGPLTIGANLAGGLPVLSAVPTAGDCLSWSAAGIVDGGACQAALGFTPLNPANNLSDLASATQAAINAGWQKGVDPRAAVYGAKCDGVTDDTTAFHAAAVAANTAGTFVIMPPAVCYVGASADLSVGSIVGTARMGDVPSTETEPGTLLVNPAHTVRFSQGSTVRQIRILRSGFTTPTTLRAGITAVANFSGTGLTLASADTRLVNIHVQGFVTSIAVQGPRIGLVGVEVDGTNGASVTGCSDTCYWSRVEASPFTTNGNHIATPNQLTTIMGITSGAGGVCQIALGSAPATPIVTGDTVVVNAAGTGTTGCSGRFTVANAIDTADFTLTGSTFGGTYTTGGSVFLTANRRTGAAFSDTGPDGTTVFVTDFTEYGWDTGLNFAGASNNRFQGLWIDGPGGLGAYSDPTPVSVNVSGTSYDNFISSMEGDANTNVFKVSSTGVSPLTVNGANIAVNGGGYAGVMGSGLNVTTTSTATAVKINNLEVKVNTNFGASTLPWAAVATGPSVYLSNVNMSSSANSSISMVNAECPNVFMDGMAGPCQSSMTLAGSGTSGTATYTNQTGWYMETTAGLLTFNFDLAISGWTASPSGNMMVRLPYQTAANLTGWSCSLSKIGGYTAPSNFGALMAFVPASIQVAYLYRQPTAGGVATQSNVSEWTPANTEIAGTCSYQISAPTR